MIYKYLSVAAVIVSLCSLLLGLYVFNIVLQMKSVANNTPENFVPKEQNILENMRPVDETDHVFGNPDAEITIVEYSDFACPWCARLHPSLYQIINESDDVRWVYRHLPFKESGMSAAVASECVASIVGDDVFWRFINELFKSESWNLTEMVANYGIAADEFEKCLASNFQLDKILMQKEEGIALGITGTPSMVVFNKQGNHLLVRGAQPYSELQKIIGAFR